jgi:hypothetical protein
VILDIYSHVVGLLIAHRESAELAERLIADTLEKENIASGPPHAPEALPEEGTTPGTRRAMQFKRTTGKGTRSRMPHSLFGSEASDAAGGPRGGR